MIVLALVIAFGGQVSAEDAARPRVSICTAQAGALDRHRAVLRPDGSLWWHPDRGPAMPFDAGAEETAASHPWFSRDEPLIIDGRPYRYAGKAQPDDLAFRRYYRPHAHVDGVPAVTPHGSNDRSIWILVHPVECRFGVWVPVDQTGD